MYTNTLKATRHVLRNGIKCVLIGGQVGRGLNTAVSTMFPDAVVVRFEVRSDLDHVREQLRKYADKPVILDTSHLFYRGNTSSESAEAVNQLIKEALSPSGSIPEQINKPAFNFTGSLIITTYCLDDTPPVIYNRSIVLDNAKVK